MAEESKADRSELFLVKGSCHCGLVSYSARSRAPVPFLVCHCLADTKTNGVQNINIRAQADTLDVTGRDHLKTYAVDLYRITGNPEDKGKKSHHKRYFCAECGSYLWAFSSKWPTWVYPFANCVDVELPAAPEHIHIFTASKLPHVSIPAGCREFEAYPDESIEAWHKRHGLLYGATSESEEGSAAAAGATAPAE